jgi:hypothetical protein
MGFVATGTESESPDWSGKSSLREPNGDLASP